MSKVQRLGAAAVILGASGLGVALWPAAATADAPIQTAWFNAVSGGGQAAPNPTTPTGGLHVAVTSNQIIAFSAVQYSLATGSTATIEFKVSNLTATPVINPTAPSTNPAVNIVACPITGAWQSGDDQSMDKAPTYDCTHSIPGSLSADQTTLTFLADSNLETIPGTLSLAIVPVLTDEIPGVGTPAPADTTQPFSLDIAKPDTTSLTITGSAPAPAAPPLPKAGGTVGPPGGNAATSGAGNSAASSSGMQLPSSLTGSTSTSTDTGSSPVVAPQNTAPVAAPVAATSSSTNDRAHNAALAMLMLIFIGLAAMGNGQLQQRAPRLLGGAGRRAAVAGAAAAAAAPVVATAPIGTRGLGRFAKPRTEPARPLT